ncbi:hypothetical protein JHK82_055611 [Glycine max]|nr:hypothetical protein JHK82_055611 [Glycine max]
MSHASIFFPSASEVLAPAVDEFLVILAPANEVLAAPAPLLDPILAPAPNRIYTYVDFVPIPPARVHVPSSYPHHLLSQNTESNHVMLSSGSSQSIHSKKYIHWTKEEHRSFLLGLEEYKESRWEKISEKFVPSKTPTQVVSHAKKFFKWKNAPKKERKRRSIHETTLDDIDMIVTPHIDQHNWLPPPPNFAV